MRRLALFKGTYLFYDLETTGLSKTFDQVLQFAAVRTDKQLNELDRYQIHVRLTPDIIPSPTAAITHRIALKDSARGLAEVDAIREIHALINEPGTISCGYNTLGFDDEFLRFSFYRNLLPPYTHQYANGCGRMDLYPMVIMYCLYQREVLEWPQENGRDTLKLEHLNAANQLAEGRAHDAMVDVEATLALAKRLVCARKMWDYLLGYFDKKEDLQRVAQLPLFLEEGEDRYQQGLLIQGSAGSAVAYQHPVISLGNSYHYKNQTLWLSLDQPALADTQEAEIPETTWVIRKKLGEPGFLLPLNSRYRRVVDEKSRTVVERNTAWLKGNPAMLRQIAEYHRHYTYPSVVGVDSGADLYLRDFLSQEEGQLCVRFHTAKPADKAKVVMQLTRPDLRERAMRVMGRYYPECMSEALMADYRTYRQTVNPAEGEQAIIDYRDQPRRTPAVALQEIDRLKTGAGLDAEQGELLNELNHYIVSNFKRNEPLQE